VARAIELEAAQPLRVFRIDQPDDPRLSGYALTAEPTALRRRGSFMAEGRFVVERLLELRRYSIESLLLNEAAYRALEPGLRQAEVRAPVYVCPPAVFNGVTGHDFHRGCLALVERPSERSPAALLADSRVLVVLEGVANADNVGSVFRNAAAFGVDAVLLSPGSGDPLYRKTIRTSMAHSLRVPFATFGGASTPWPGCLEQLRQHGFELLALTPGEPSLDLAEYARRPERAQRFALLVGTEGDGLSDQAAALASFRLRIPMRPEVDSLNLAVATGIALSSLMSS
jgi:tRNA G18 (ribose-2'-O)-methylase SpoU